MKSLVAVISPILVSAILFALLVVVAVTVVVVAKEDTTGQDYEAAQRALAKQRHPSTGPHAEPYDWQEEGGL